MSVIVESVAVPDRKITRLEVESFKREILEQAILVTPKEAARVLGCSESTVYRLVRSGRLPAYSENRWSKGLRIRAVDLLDYVRSIKIDADEWRE